MTTVQAPHRLRFVASRFNQLKGLVAVPLGAALLVDALLAIRSPYHSVISTPLQALVLAAGFLASLLIYRYYQRTFGRVRQAPAMANRDIRPAWSSPPSAWSGSGS